MTLLADKPKRLQGQLALNHERHASEIPIDSKLHGNREAQVNRLWGSEGSFTWAGRLGASWCQSNAAPEPAPTSTRLPSSSNKRLQATNLGERLSLRLELLPLSLAGIRGRRDFHLDSNEPSDSQQSSAEQGYTSVFSAWRSRTPFLSAGWCQTRRADAGAACRCGVACFTLAYSGAIGSQTTLLGVRGPAGIHSNRILAGYGLKKSNSRWD
jgi:hypothetical protein